MKNPYQIIKDENKILAINKKPFVYTAFVNDEKYPSLEREIYHTTKKNYEVFYPVEIFTSGVTLLSKDEILLKDLRESLNNNEWIFTYDLIVKAPVFFDEEIVTKPLSFKVKKIEIDPTGEPYTATFKIIYKYRNYAHITASTSKPLAGVILLFASFLGSPVMGDKYYGLKENIFLSTLKKRKFKPKKGEEDERPLTERPLIHLSKAIHPKWGEYDAPFSKDFRSVIEKLNKYNRFIEEDVFLQEILESLQNREGENDHTS